MENVFVWTTSDVIAFCLVCIAILVFLFTIMKMYVSYLYMRVVGMFKGYYIQTVDSGYNTGYGRVPEYTLRYKYKWKDDWTIYEICIKPRRLKDKIKELKTKLENEKNV